MIKTWWQVYIGYKIFGFSSQNGIISDVPKYPSLGHVLIGCDLKNNTTRSWFIENKCKVVKIADQCMS